MARATLTGGILALMSTSAFASEWDIDTAHSKASFSVRHMMVSTVRGQFGNMSGTITLDDKDLTRSSLEVSIDAASIDTHEPKRDTHLKSPDFFDVEKFPSIAFKSKKITKAARGTYKVDGELSMHGVTRPVTFHVDSLTEPMKSPWGTLIRGVSATAKINRKDWGLTWNKPLETGGVIVGEEVQLQIDAELVAKAPPKDAPAK